VDLGKAEELAGARRIELSRYSDANMGTRAYAAFLSIARGGIYGHAAMLLMSEGALVDILKSTPSTAYRVVDDIAGARGETADPSSSRRGAKAGGIAGGAAGRWICCMWRRRIGGGQDRLCASAVLNRIRRNRSTILERSRRGESQV